MNNKIEKYINHIIETEYDEIEKFKSLSIHSISPENLFINLPIGFLLINLFKDEKITFKDIIQCSHNDTLYPYM